MSTISVGDSYPDFQSLENKIKSYSKQNYIQFYKRESRTIDAAKKKINRFINPNLEYYQIVYCCIRGGIKFKSKSKGDRISHTYQSDCPATIRVRVSADGNKLEIISMITHHNHEISKKLFEYLPQNKHPPPKVKAEVEALLKLEADKKLLVEKIHEKTSKVQLMKDLKNIPVASEHADKNDISKVAETLKNEYGADWFLLVDEERNFRGLLFSTWQMQAVMDAYPEFLGIGVTSNLLEIGTPVYLICAEDSNGKTVVVFVCILAADDKESMLWFFEKFKDMNPSWVHTKSIMADSMLPQRQVLKQSFPEANVLYCSSQMVRIFSREITTQNMKISAGQRKLASDLLQKMIRARNAQMFDRLYQEMLKVLPEVIIHYFDLNWKGNRNEWSACGNFYVSNFLNVTNSRFECINTKLKNLMGCNSPLEVFIEQFFTLMNIMSDDRDQAAVKLIQKSRIAHYTQGSPEERYCDHLTEFAAKFVLKELNRVEEVDLPAVVNTRVKIATKCGFVITTTTRCTCHNALSMLLPCKHMFAVRRFRELDLFDEALCAERWTVSYCKSHLMLCPDTPDEVLQRAEEAGVVERPAGDPLNEWAHGQVTELMRLLAMHMSGAKLEERLDTLLKLKQTWEAEDALPPANLANNDFIIVDIVSDPREIHEETVYATDFIIPHPEDSDNHEIPTICAQESIYATDFIIPRPEGSDNHEIPTICAQEFVEEAGISLEDVGVPGDVKKRKATEDNNEISVQFMVQKKQHTDNEES